MNFTDPLAFIPYKSMPLKYDFATFPYEKLVSNSNHTLAYAGLVGKNTLDQHLDYFESI